MKRKRREQKVTKKEEKKKKKYLIPGEANEVMFVKTKEESIYSFFFLNTYICSFTLQCSNSFS